MTDEKILEVLTIYEKELETAAGTHADHLATMIPKIKEFLKEGRREKAFRWLGFMQGVFWANDVYTIDEMKNHNRP